MVKIIELVSMTTDKDITFIAKKLKTSKEIISKLTEEPEDFNLIAEELVKKKLKKKDYAGLSFGLYSKLVIFSDPEACKFEISEKCYVAKIIGELFPRLNNRENFGPFIRKITPEPTESGAKYYFVISSLFNDKVNCKDNAVIQEKYISAGLNCSHSTLYKHIPEWISILRGLKKRGYFSVTIQEDKIPELQSCPRYSLDPISDKEHK